MLMSNNASPVVVDGNKRKQGDDFNFVDALIQSIEKKIDMENRSEQKRNSKQN